jgi:hypothetical protein
LLTFRLIVALLLCTERRSSPGMGWFTARQFSHSDGPGRVWAKKIFQNFSPFFGCPARLSATQVESTSTVQREGGLKHGKRRYQYCERCFLRYVQSLQRQHGSELPPSPATAQPLSLLTPGLQLVHYLDGSMQIPAGAGRAAINTKNKLFPNTRRRLAPRRCCLYPASRLE